ncbi:MAG: mammalian cell entry protein [Mycobacterium sp.]|nr:mammalian cell entry protein [Mycobacterium sp.]
MGRARSVAATAGVLVVAVALVVLAGFAGAGYYNLSTAEAAQLSRAQLRQLAFDAVPKVFGFDYQTVEASMTEAEGLLTPAYRIEFAERAKTDIIPAARERRLVTQVTVTGAGVLDAHRDTGSVLVFMNRTVTDKSKKSQYDGSRLRVDFTRVDGHWLINYIVPV